MDLKFLNRKEKDTTRADDTCNEHIVKTIQWDAQ